MPTYAYNPNPAPLTQEEKDAYAAQQAAMQAAPASGTYFPPPQTSFAPPVPSTGPAPGYATEPLGGNDTITGYNSGYGGPTVGPYSVSDASAGPTPAPYDSRSTGAGVSGPFGLPSLPSGRPTLDFVDEVGLPTRDFTDDVVGTGVQLAHDANDYARSLVRPTPFWNYTIWSRAEKLIEQRAARRRADQSAAGSYEEPNRDGKRGVPFVNVEDALMGPVSGPITPGQYFPRIAGAGHRGAAGADMARRAASAQDAFGAWLDERLPPY